MLDQAGAYKLSVTGQASGIGLATAKAFHEAEHLQSEWLSEMLMQWRPLPRA
jgi:hypothetical protein